MKTKIDIEVHSDNRQDIAAAVALAGIAISNRENVLVGQGRYALSDETGKEYYFNWYMENSHE